MRLPRLLVVTLSLAVLSAPLHPAESGSVELKLQVEATAALGGFFLVLVELPDPRISHCQGKKIVQLDQSSADPSPDGGYRWHYAAKVGPTGEGRTDSLVLCRPEGGILKPLWSGRIRTLEGKRLIGLDCWIEAGFALDCGARYALPG